MGIIRNLRKRSAIKRLTRDLSSPAKECLAVLLTAFTDERFSSLVEHFEGSSMRHLSEASSLGREHHNLMDRLQSFIHDALDSAELFPSLAEAVRIMAAVVKERDPDGSRYPESQRRRPEDIVWYADYFRRLPESVTDEQKHALVTVTFLTHQRDVGDGTHAFRPDADPHGSKISYDKVITDRIMANPTADLTAIAEEHLNRTTRRVELQERFKEDFYYSDNICDYPEHILQRLERIRNEQHRKYWLSALDLISLPEMTAEAMERLLSLSGELVDHHKLYYLHAMSKTVEDYPEIKDSHESTPEELWQRRVSLLHVAVTIHFHHHDRSTRLLRGNRITDQRIINLLIQHPEHRDVIIDIIKERKLCDYDQIESALQMGALGSGTL